MEPHRFCKVTGAPTLPSSASSTLLFSSAPKTQLGPGARTPSIRSLLEGQSQPSCPGVVKGRASVPADPAPRCLRARYETRTRAAPRWAWGTSFLPAWYFPPRFGFGIFFIFFLFTFFFFLHSPKGHTAVGGAGKLSAGRYQQHDSLPGPCRLLQPDGCPPSHRSEVPFVDSHLLACPHCLPLFLLSGSTIPLQQCGVRCAAPSPGTATGMRPRAGIPTGWMGSSMRLAGQEPPSSHLISVWGSHLLPVCKQLLGLLWDGSRAPGRVSHKWVGSTEGPPPSFWHPAGAESPGQQEEQGAAP